MFDDHTVDQSLQDDEKFVVNGLLDESIVFYNPSDDDFISRSYQSQLIECARISNRILFLPIYRDKLYITGQLIKYFCYRNEKKRSIYVTLSGETIEDVVIHMRRHLHLNIIGVFDVMDDSLYKHYQNAHLIVLCCSSFLQIVDKLKNYDLNLLVLDDCIHLLSKEKIQQITNESSKLASVDRPRIVGLTSSLIYQLNDITCFYQYLKEMEIATDASIVSTRRCNVVKKYLTNTKVKFVKFSSQSRKWYDSSTTSSIKDIIDDSLIFIEKVLHDESNILKLWEDLSAILESVKDCIAKYGLYPAFIAASIYQIRLEEMKLSYGQSLFTVLSTLISNFNAIRSLICQEINKTGPLHSTKSIITNCEEKIIKLISLLYRIDFQDNCITFVSNSITAQILSYILQKLHSKFLPNIIPDYLIAEYSISSPKTCREKYLQTKRRKITLKKFFKGETNVLITSWDSKFYSHFLNADRIIYFDMPPTYRDYVVSRKYANSIKNCNFFFVEKSNLDDNVGSLEHFRDLDLSVKEVLQKKDINNIENLVIHFRKSWENEVDLNDKFPPFVSKSGNETNLSTAIELLNKYCEELPGDAFAPKAPRLSVHKKREGVVCKVELPIQSGIKFSIENAPVKNIKFVKNITALETIKTLYAMRHVNDELMPMVRHVEELNNSELFPHWKEEPDYLKPGSLECCRVVPIHFPEWLSNCSPEPDVECFLHIIDLKPTYKVPTMPRKLFFHKLMVSESKFGILSSKKLPQVCSFPIYTDLGSAEVHFTVNARSYFFNAEQLEKLRSFHNFIFFDILEVVKGFLICDISNSENSYCICPLCPSNNGDGGSDIAWNVVYDLTVKEEIQKPSDEERILGDYSVKNYLGRVVTPWYRVFPQRYYIITNVLTDCTPNSPFSSDEFETYSEYYESKYSLEVKQPLQPLLEARCITTNLNYIRPRAQNSGTRRKRGEKEVDFSETLLPEFCVLQSFPAVYWYKSITLLAITHRLHFILNAETIRKNIAHGSESSNTYDDIDVLVADNACITEIEVMFKPVIPVSTVLKDVKVAKRIRYSPCGDERLPAEIEKNLNNVSLLEIMIHHDFIKVPDKINRRRSQVFDTTVAKKSLNSLTLTKGLFPGPKLSDIVQALTTSQSGDIVNLEKLKLIGNSFINFGASLMLFNFYNHLNVYQLNLLKKKLTGKRNLFYCGSKLQLGSFVKLRDLSVNCDWNLARFCLPEWLISVLQDSETPPEVIFNLEIPREEQESGLISSKTRNCIHEKMLNYHNETSKCDDSYSENRNHALMYLRKQSVADKTVVNVLKALTGAYLMNCGVRSGLLFLQHVGILSQKLTIDNLYYSSRNIKSSNQFYGFESICDKLKYKFTTAELLIETFTHHSSFPDSETECNLKLAALGEATLEFLITNYIFEYCKDFSIDQIKDLLFALVSDIFYSALLVRLGLHKFLSIESPYLHEKIDKFVQRQENVNHIMDHNEYLFLIEETNSQEVNSVDVPKALSDTFKALVAAVFLDCGGRLETVWNVYYEIMKIEIDKFVHRIPKNPIEALRDTDTQIEFGYPEMMPKDSTLTKIRLRVFIDNQKRNYVGIGTNKRHAKIIAAKLALKSLYKEFTL